MTDSKANAATLAAGKPRTFVTGTRAAVAAIAAAASFGALAGSASAATADCSRPADGRKNTVECRILIPGIEDGRKFTYAFVRKGCYHPGSAVAKGGEVVVRRNDIGNGTWHISLAPKPRSKANQPLRFAFRVTSR